MRRTALIEDPQRHLINENVPMLMHLPCPTLCSPYAQKSQMNFTVPLSLIFPQLHMPEVEKELFMYCPFWYSISMHLSSYPCYGILFVSELKPRINAVIHSP